MNILAVVLSWELLGIILQVAIGLGAVIFVHELGHFLVAKACGVKCEKFMVGFDIGGYKLSRRWGETVYGIGILPLGGYVKMLGQDDNPANIAEQVEKSQVANADSPGVEITGPDGKKYAVDRRSYLAKSVPQRMAIISAGVVMNIIFAVIFAVIAFGLGVPYLPCVVSKTVPGSPAWEAGLRTGDDIVKVGEHVDPTFSQLTGSVTLADLEKGVPVVVRRAGTDDQLELTLKPRQQNGTGLAKIGILSSPSLRLAKKYPTLPGSAANESGFQGGDEIIRAGDVPVNNYRELAAQLIEHVRQPLEVTVRRGGIPDPKDPYAPRSGGDEVTLTVPPNAMKRLGLIMTMGPVDAVQHDSPAAQAGIQPGDLIVGVNDKSVDPATLPMTLRNAAQDGQTVKLTIQRGGTGNRAAGSDAANEMEIEVTPRVADWLESTNVEGTPESAPALGIAYNVQNLVAAVDRGSPAERAGLKPGDKLIGAEVSIPVPDQDQPETMEVKLGDAMNWPMLMGTLRSAPINTKVTLSYERDGTSSKATLEPWIDADDPVYVAERGFNFEPLLRIQEAKSLGQQLRLGWDKTRESLLLVYRFLQKIGTQVPVTALGGPVEIAKQAGGAASMGISSLLIFLTMLSANLAVINFLPIPLLDGGHMVFLAYEGIFRRPASERFVVAMHLAGFVFIIGLMVFLVALDVGLIPRNL